jgi:uncharacterized protein YpmS
MDQTKTKVLLLLAGILLVMLACTIFIGGPDYPSTRIPVSTEAVGEFRSTMEAAVAAGALSGELTITITEEQLTSYLAMKLQEQAKPFLTDPQVTLRDGQIKVFGTAQQGYFEATISIVLTAGVSDTGELFIEVSSIDFGPLPVPEGIRDAISATIEEAYTGAIGPAATGLRLETVQIEDGVMTITGRTQ